MSKMFFFYSEDKIKTLDNDMKEIKTDTVLFNRNHTKKT